MQITIDPPLPQEYQGHFRSLTGFDPEGIGGYSLIGKFLGGDAQGIMTSVYTALNPPRSTAVFGIKGGETVALLLMVIDGYQDVLEMPIDLRDRKITTQDCRIVAFASNAYGHSDPRYLDKYAFEKASPGWDGKKLNNPYYLIGASAVSRGLCVQVTGQAKQPGQTTPTKAGYQPTGGQTRLEIVSVNLPDLADGKSLKGADADGIIFIMGEDQKMHSMAWLVNHIGELTGAGWYQILTDQAQKMDAASALMRVLATSAQMSRAIETPGAKEHKKKKR